VAIHDLKALHETTQEALSGLLELRRIVRDPVYKRTGPGVLNPHPDGATMIKKENPRA
jgi:hypothetical protein